MIRRIMTAGTIYFTIVFGSGFILGIIRVLFVVPRIGERYAELFEIPLMLVVIYYSARLIVRQFRNFSKTIYYFYAGLFAFLLLIFTEISIVSGMRGISLKEYITSRDGISGIAYLISLIIFMILPYLLARSKTQ